MRIPIVEEIPDHLDSGAPRRFGKGLDGREIVAPPANVDERPSDSLSCGMDAKRIEVEIVLLDRAVVSRGHYLIEPVTVSVVAGGPLEAGQEKAAEHPA